MQKPPPDVQKVGEAVTCLLASIDPGVKTDKQGNPEDKSWTGCTKLMSNPQNFIDGLIAYKGHIDNQAVPAKNFRNVRPYIALENFKGDIIFNKSRAAAGLCEWVRNIVEYYDVVSEVEPKRIALKKAENDLQEANDKLEVINAKVAEL